MDKTMQTRWRAGIALALAVALIATPVLAQDTAADAVRDARQHAERDVSPLLWGGLGFVCSCFGVAGAYVYVPSPPAPALIGKSSEYVIVYTDTYKRVARNKQLTYSVGGCAAESALSLMVRLFLAAGGS